MDKNKNVELEALYVTMRHAAASSAHSSITLR